MRTTQALELKKKWRSGAPSPGMWVRYTDPTVLESIASVEFDWVMIDAEHSAIDLQTLQTMFFALKGSPTLPFVRVPGHDHSFIKQLLDVGAAGVLAPHIKSVDEARRIIAACKYPPQGIRGAGPRRPSDYGRTQREYFDNANQATFVMLMIETVGAVEDFDEILALEGLDGLIFGPADLSMSMGLHGDQSHTEVKKIVSDMMTKARAAGVAFGGYGPVVVADPSEWIELGVQIIGISDDQKSVMGNAAAAMERFKSVMAARKE